MVVALVLISIAAFTPAVSAQMSPTSSPWSSPAPAPSQSAAPRYAYLVPSAAPWPASPQAAPGPVSPQAAPGPVTPQAAPRPLTRQTAPWPATPQAAPGPSAPGHPSISAPPELTPVGYPVVQPSSPPLPNDPIDEEGVSYGPGAMIPSLGPNAFAFAPGPGDQVADDTADASGALKLSAAVGAAAAVGYLFF